MSAQTAGSITLAYGPQGVQQGGAGVVLSYTPPAPVRRTLAATLGAPWPTAHAHQRSTRAIMLHTVAANHATGAPWRLGAPRQSQNRQPWLLAAQREAHLAALWSTFATFQTHTSLARWVLSDRRDTGLDSIWGAFFSALSVQPHAAWLIARPADSGRGAPWGTYAGQQAKAVSTAWLTAHATDAMGWAPWRRFSRDLAPGWGVVTPPNPTPDEALFAILPARFYMVTHDVFAQRLPDLVDVPIYEAAVSADRGSYCWSLTAIGPASLFDLLAPVVGVPAQLRVTMDGIEWVFAVDSPGRRGQFGKNLVTIQGRSVTSLIGGRYFRPTTRDNASGDATAQQLALAALQYTGIDLDWGLTDWLVPAGAWSHQGTPLQAVQAIAQAAGGYLQSHRSLPILQVRHPYAQRIGDLPGAPWGWMSGAADVELATDALITESRDPLDSPDINGLYVSGTTSGVLALVKRSGTAADKLDAMVTDPLITHHDAARQRGLAALGAAGRRYQIDLSLPVLTGAGQPGVLSDGQLVQVNDATPWRGRVRGVNVSAKMPSVRQMVSLERHLEAA